MASEGMSSNEHDGNRERIRAITQLNRELEALVPSLCSREKFMEIVGKHAVKMFDMTPAEAQGLVVSLEGRYYIPSDKEINDDTESATDLLRTGLFMDYIQEYAFLFSKEEFREWVEPFIRAMLLGHTEESASLEHLEGCPDDRFCSAQVIVNYITDIIGDGPAVIKGNQLYVSHADEIINMYVTVLQVLEKLKLVEASRVEELLDDYRWWLESIEGAQIDFDRGLFEAS